MNSRYCLAVLLVASSLRIARAQDREKDSLDEQPAQRLVLGDAPKDWKPRPREDGEHFLCDFDLAAAQGDPEPARVNVLYSPLGFEDYRAKILGSWTNAKGEALTKSDQKTETLAEGELTLRSIEQAGTYAHEGAPVKKGWKLVAVHVRANGEQWTAWLIGPEKTVGAHEAAYRAWVKTARVEASSEAVRAVRFVHGAPDHGVPGPWALASYRIGKDALRRLGITRDRAWDLVVTHRSPREPRYACMLDGLVAATGASPGKLNLVHEVAADEEHTETVILHKPTGRKLTYKLVKAYRDAIRELPPEKFPEAAKALDAKKDDEVFTVVEEK